HRSPSRNSRTTLNLANAPNTDCGSITISLSLVLKDTHYVGSTSRSVLSALVLTRQHYEAILKPRVVRRCTTSTCNTRVDTNARIGIKGDAVKALFVSHDYSLFLDVRLRANEPAARAGTRRRQPGC